MKRNYIAETILVGLWSGSLFGANSPDYPVDVRATVTECTPEAVVVSMELKNGGKDRIELFKSDLPWGVRTSVVIVIVTHQSAPTMLEPALFIDDPRPGEITLNPTQAVSGSINLSRLFPTLIETLRKRDLIVFWSYTARLINGTSSSRSSGSVLLESARCSKK